MFIKFLKVAAVVVVVIVVLAGLLYTLAPYLIRRSMNLADIKTEPAKYMQLSGLPKDGVVLFVTAHPDDFEWWSAGTVPKLLERGNKVYLAVLTNGGKQKYAPEFYSRMIIKTRRAEQIKLAKMQHLTGWFLFDYSDGSFKYSEKAFNDIMKVAKKIGATDIFTFPPKNDSRYRDSDHTAAGEVGTTVANKYDNVEALYYFSPRNPNVVVDITDTFDNKIKILKVWTEFKYRRSAIAGIQRQIYGAYGKRIGVKYAEAYVRIPLHDKKTQQAQQGIVHINDMPDKGVQN